MLRWLSEQLRDPGARAMTKGCLSGRKSGTPHQLEFLPVVLPEVDSPLSPSPGVWPGAGPSESPSSQSTSTDPCR